MGSRGPVPKRMSERLGHVTKAQRSAVTSVSGKGRVRPPALPRRLHPIARRWYRSLENSGQAQLFEPSDWAAAVYVAEALSRLLGAERLSAQGFAAVWNAMGDLLTTESARRRVRVEVERELGKDAEDEADVSVLEEYRRMLQG